MKICGAVILIAVLMGIAKFWKRRVFVFILIGISVCFIAAFANEVLENKKDITYIEKNETGLGETEKNLVAETKNGEKVYMTLTIPEKVYSESEIENILNYEMGMLDKVILGENTSFDNVNKALVLPKEGVNENVYISWQSSLPDKVNQNGELQAGISPEGEKVVLKAVLQLQDEEREYLKEITVFPKAGTGNLKEDIKKEAEYENRDSKDEIYRLPSNVNGEEIKWFETYENNYVTIAVFILIGGILLQVNVKQKEEDKLKKRRERLKREYPELISRLLLMLYSGTGVRTAFFRLAETYNRSDKNKKSEIFSELAITCREIESGISEEKAYEKLAERCSLPCYRSLCVLLIQNRKKGGSGFINALEQEAAVALGEKRRQAEISGDAASLKLLIPLAMMLMVTLALMIIPAFLSM